MSTHFFGLKERAYSYSHSVGRNEFAGTGFRNPVDMVIGDGNVLYALNRSYENRPDGVRVSVMTLDEEYVTEFGRRISDNGSGTDHGSAGIAFAIGEGVKGGIYGEYPSLEPGKQEEGGNLKFNLDFRSVYTTILEDWFRLDAKPIVGGSFEKVKFL